MGRRVSIEMISATQSARGPSEIEQAIARLSPESPACLKCLPSRLPLPPVFRRLLGDQILAT
jgi:hypothetical protein